MAPLIGLAGGIFLAGSFAGGTSLYLKLAGAVMIAICIIAASIFVKRGKRAVSFLVFLELGIILLSQAAAGIERDLKFACPGMGEDGGAFSGEVKGIIEEVDIHDDYVAFVLKCGQGEAVNRGGYRILASVYGDSLSLENPGDAAGFTGCEAVFYGKPEEPKGQRNPHCFDYKRYLSTKGICAVMNSKVYEIGEISNPVLHKIAVLKADFADCITELSGDECAGLISGILFGEKGSIDEDTYDMFKKNGTAHILAVSGLHIGIVYGFAVKLARGRKTRRSRLFAAIFITVYIVVAGFTPSVTRAGAMILLHILSKELRMRYDMLSAAAGVCILNLIINPLALWNTGFQLSYLAIFTICFVAGRFSGGSDNRGKGLKYAFISCFSVQLGLAPYMAFQFNCFSLVSVFLNIPVIFIAGLLVPLAIAMFYALCILETLPWIDFESVSKAFEFGAFLLEKLCGCLKYLNDLAFMDGHSSFTCVSPPVWAIGIYYGLLFFICSETGFILFRRRRIKRIALSLVIITALSFFANAMYIGPADRAGIVFVDVGQGDCMHLRAGGKNVLIDSGGSFFTEVGEKTLKPYLLKNGCVKVDLAVITHLHTDHCKGLDEISDDIEIKNLCVYEGYSPKDVREALPNYRGRVTFLKRGDILHITDSVSIEILAPAGYGRGTGAAVVTANKEDENSMSLIAKVDYDGLTAMMTADIDEAGEKALLQLCSSAKSGGLCCDILKIAHHGSKYSSCEEFLSAVSPAAAVIQVGKNNYGHPACEVLERCAALGIPVYRNDLSGAIFAYDIKNGNYRLGFVLK